MTAFALDLDGALGDTGPLWRAWLEDLERRSRVDLDGLPEDRVAAAARLDDVVTNWRALLARFAEDRAPVFLRPDSATTASLRWLQAEGHRLGVFTDAPEELAQIALAHLAAARRVEAVEAGAGALERLLERLGGDAVVVRSRAELTSAGH
jgi:phosphoglycolate phosphatase-like HAD superfamily hydrolase